jgi:SNF2 family DNA or RNA helicase
VCTFITALRGPSPPATASRSPATPCCASTTSSSPASRGISSSSTRPRRSRTRPPPPPPPPSPCRPSWRIALSGTPVENRLLELWSLAHFCNPGLLGGRKEFTARYARRIELGHAFVASELQAKIRPFLLRRRKAEVAPELPPRTDLVLRCILDPDERAVYDGLRLATHSPRSWSASPRGGTVIEALELLLRLRQAACHPALVPGQTATRSSKVDLLLEQLQEIASEGHRALVFSQWTGLLDLVEAS